MPDSKVDIAQREDVSPKEGTRDYGDVQFADPINHRYPIDCEEHIRAAWSYLHQGKNADKYPAEDVARMKSRIVAAWKKLVDPKGPPSARVDGVMRFDAGALGKAETTPEGWLKVHARIARAGIYEYRNPDGTVRRELRAPEEVFKADSLDTFVMRPVTDDHPWAESPPLLTPANARTYQRGSTGESVIRSGDYVETTLMITDGSLIEKIKGGTQEVSAGYLADTVWEPGEWHGQPYDCYQENIRGNHVAILLKGRAGDDVRLRLDSGAAVAIRRICDGNESISEPQEQAMSGEMTKTNIAGIDFDVPAQVAQALDKHNAEHKAELKSHKEKADKAGKCDKCDSAMSCPKCDAPPAAEKDSTKTDADSKALADALQKEKARADVAEAKLAASEKARVDAADPKIINARVSARVALETQAREILGAEAKLDTMDDLEVKKTVLGKIAEQVKLDGKDPVYVDAAYDSAMALVGRKTLGELRVATGAKFDGKESDPKVDASFVWEKNRVEQANAWKRNTTKENA